MPASSRAVRLLAGLFIVLLAIPVALSTPWVKAWLFERATSWARGRYGVEIRAARFDYRLASLTVTADELTVADATIPDRPFLRVARLDIDFAASVFRGRPAFDAIGALRPTIVLDSTTRPPGPPGRPTSQDGRTALPPFDVGEIEIQDLDLAVGDEGAARVVLRQLSASLRGQGPGSLEGDVSIAGGAGVSFGTDAIGVAFDRVDGRVAMIEGSRARGSLTASSPVAELRAEGTVPLDPSGRYDLRYEATADIGQLQRWWTDSPDWTGRVTVRGEVAGPLASPEASFEVRSSNLAWRAFAAVTVAATGQVSNSGVTVDAFSLASPPASVEGHARLAFGAADRSTMSAECLAVATDAVIRGLALSSSPASRALIDGSTSLSWSGPWSGTSGVEGRVTATATGAGSDHTAVGTFVADGRGGRWQVGYRQSLDGNTRLALDSAAAIDQVDPARSTLAGSVTVRSGDISEALRQLRRLGLPVPAVADAIGTEQVAFAGMLAGSLGAPRLSGELSADGVRAGPVGGLHVGAAIALDRQTLDVSPLRLESPGNRVVLDGTLAWSTGDGQGTLDARIEDPAHLAATLPEGWRPAGTLELSGRWSGTGREPAVSARLTGSNVTINGLAFETLSGDLVLAHRMLRLTELRATQPEGSLSASASWNLGDSTLIADATGGGLALSVLTSGETGAQEPRARLTGFSIDAHVEGPAARIVGHTSLTADAVEIDGRALGGMQGRLDAAEGEVHMTAAVREHGVSLDGRLTLGSPWPFEGRLAFERSNVAKLGQLAGLGDEYVEDVSASLDATIDGSGNLQEVADASVSIALNGFDGEIRGRALSLRRPGRVLVANGAVTVDDPVQLSLGAVLLDLTQASGATGATGPVATLEGPIADLVSLVPSLMPEGITADGTVRAEVHPGERLTALEPAGHLTVDLASLHRGEQELARGVKVVADAGGGEIRVSQLTGTVLESPVEARGTVPMAWLRTTADGRTTGASEPATLSLKSDVALGPILPALSVEGLDVAGTLHLTLEATALEPRIESIRATLRDEAGELKVSALTVTEQQPTELRFEDGRLLVDQFDWRGVNSGLTASGSLGLASDVDGRLRLKGRSSLTLLDYLLPGRLDGSAAFDLEMSGPPGDRALLGTIALDNGSLIVQPWRLALADWSGTFALDANNVTIEGLRGQINGGEASIEGRFPIGDDASTNQTVAFTVRNAFLDVPRGLRSQLDAALTWSNAEGRPRLTGEATITADTYREPVTRIAGMVSSLIETSGGPAAALPAVLAATELDVRLATIGPLAMTNSVARVELVPDLRLSGTMARPALSGQVAVADDGRIQVSGRQYRLRDSRVEFRAKEGLVPRLDVTGNTRVGDYTVYLRFSGPASEIQTSLTSDPPLGERDLQTLLVTGQRSDLSAGGQTDQSAVGAVSGDVLGFAGQFLGFDSVRVGTTDDLSLVSSDVNPALRLTVSKRISNRFELVLSDNLDDNELTWVIIYRPRPGFEFRLLSRESRETSVEFRQEIGFGPGVSPARTAAPARPARERIAAVTISGDPGFAPSEALSVTKLRSGNRFDFARWLEDRERLARFYVERGYFATRIVPTRQPADGANGESLVALDYRVTRGPRTTLLVTGYAATPTLVARLREAWSDSVLLDLLDTELSDVTREYLIDAGYLRARIQVEVERAAPDEVTATVRVEPGPLTTTRHLTFSGNRVMDEGALRAIAASGDLGSAAWRDPAPVLEAIESAYAARGHLAARAVARAFEFADGSATLPIDIIEGPEARVATLTVAGADRLGQAEATAATGLAVGSTYVAGSEQPARLRLERHYRDRGYRDVVVEARRQVDAGQGRVDIAMEITEGPQYLVREVRTTGVESTRASLVERATRIEPGTPASPAVAAATWRRIYDVGTFRAADVTFAPVEGTQTPDTVPVDAVVSVQESRRYLFLYGVETTNQYEPAFDQRLTSAGLAADLRDRNFMGRGWTLGAGLRYEPRFKSARAIASVPRLGSRLIRTNVYGNLRREDRYSSDNLFLLRDDETAVTIEQRWRPKGSIDLSWGYSFNYRAIQVLATDTGERILDFAGNLAALGGAVVVDRRDSLFDATRGWLVSTSAEWGLQQVGSDLGYVRTMVRGSLFQPLGPLTLASNIRWGNLQPIDGRPPLSVIDLFFTAGGTQTVRGYKQDSLSAYEPRGIPIGGARLVVLNQEIRFPLFWLLSGVAFADAGNTFTYEGGIDLGRLIVGTGFGLRIRTPLAPIRIDLGFPVSRRPGERSGRWHFSIGHMF